MKLPHPLLDFAIHRALAATAGGTLDLARLNELLPAEFPVEELDHLFDALAAHDLVLVDRAREDRVARRAAARGEVAAAVAKTGRKGDAAASDTVDGDGSVAASVGAARPARGGSEGGPSHPAIQGDRGADESGPAGDELTGLTADEQLDLLANPLRSYLGVQDRSVRLGPEDEDALVARAVAGDAEARGALVEAFMPLVVRLARRYRRSGVPLMELVLSGNEGLVEAANHLESRPGVPFRMGAQWWIRQRLSRCVAENWQGTRLPPPVSRRLRRLAAVTARYRVRRGTDPSAAFLARALRIPLDEVFLLRGLFESPLSLQTPWGADGETGTLADVIADRQAADGRLAQEERTRREDMDRLLQTLGVVEREILALRYGLRDRVDRSVDEVARMTGLSRREVSEAERSGLTALRSLIPPRSA